MAEFELFEGWETWGGNGITDIPGKNVVLENGNPGSILVDTEGIGVYSVSLDELHEVDMGEVWIDGAGIEMDTSINKEGNLDLVRNWLNSKDFDEAVDTFKKYYGQVIK